MSDFQGFTPEVYADPEPAYAAVTAWVETVAAEHDWTELEKFSVLDSVDAAYEKAGAAWSLAGWLWNPDTNKHDQADVFWSELVAASAEWLPEGSDAMRATIGAAAVTLNSIHEEEAANDILTQVGGAAAATATDVQTTVQATASSPATWAIVAGAAVLILVLVSKGR